MGSEGVKLGFGGIKLGRGAPKLGEVPFYWGGG